MKILKAIGLFILMGFVFYFTDIPETLNASNYFKSNVSEKLHGDTPFAFHSGDIIFQTSLSRQSKAIQMATRSNYSHCGMILKKDNGLFVLEAMQPIVLTLLETFISRGEKGHFVIKRLKNDSVVHTLDFLKKVSLMSDSFIGKNYDFTFEWSDEKLYCSELVWKLYKRAANVEVGELEKLKSFDLSDPLVKRVLKSRYGDKVPMNELVISPEAIFKSDQLETVYSKN